MRIEKNDKVRSTTNKYAILQKTFPTVKYSASKSIKNLLHFNLMYLALATHKFQW